MKVEWVKLADFGQYSHPKGLQILNEKAANAIIDSFRSLRGRLMRKFLGLPIYIGHPDDKDFLSKHDKIYGRIENFKVDDFALWVLIKWTKAGSELFKNGILRYLSPRWMTVPLEGGKLMPKRMLSVGLTNHPNIRCDHISKLEEIRDEPSDCVEGTVEENHCVSEDPVDLNLQPTEIEFSGNNPQLEGSQLDQPEEEDQTVNIPERIFLHTVSQTDGLKFSNFNKSNGEKILELVFDRMQKFSEQYNDAWSSVKRSNPALFDKNF